MNKGNSNSIKITTVSTVVKGKVVLDDFKLKVLNIIVPEPKFLNSFSFERRIMASKRSKK